MQIRHCLGYFHLRRTLKVTRGSLGAAGECRLRFHGGSVRPESFCDASATPLTVGFHLLTMLHSTVFPDVVLVTGAGFP